MTMTAIQRLREQAAAAAAQATVDMSQASTGGGGERRLYPDGFAFAQLVEVIEFGKQPQEFGGKAKQPALEFRLGFALWGGDPAKPDECYNNADGSPGFIRTWDIALSNNEKARAKLLFDKLNYKGTAKSFAELIGEKYLVHILVKSSKADATKKFNDIDLKDIRPPFDPVSRTPYSIPDAPDDLFRMFLWSMPTKEGWDSLHIEGTNDAGKSKNFLQEKCFAALDFPGSPLELMLRGAGAHIPTPEELAAASAPAAPPVPTAPVAAPVAPAAPPVAPTAPIAPPAAPAAPAVPADVPFDGGVPTTLPQAPVAPPAVPAAPPAMPVPPTVPAV